MSAEDATATTDRNRKFAIICVLGPPGAGKGTLSAHLVEQYGLAHMSVGDALRDWMRENPTAPLAAAIQDKLDNQGFLTSQELDPFIGEAIKAALNDRKHGILLDGYPRCLEQLHSFDSWPFEDTLARGPSEHAERSQAPDVVLAVHVNKANARARYVGRTRDARDSADKFEKRFAEYEAETLPAEEVYRRRGFLVGVDANGTKRDNVAELERQLRDSALWKEIGIEPATKTGLGL